MAAKVETLKDYSADLIAPNGDTSRYDVVAVNKANARKQISEIYRTDVPRNAKAHGFYSFADHKLVWIEGEEIEF